MLSAAHVLAMDAKNLLDVVDSIRARYPELFAQQQPTPTFSYEAYQYEAQQTIAAYPQPSARSDDNADLLDRQTYQNLSNITEPPVEMASAASSSWSSGQNEQIYQNNQPNSGIYDNECVINAQTTTSNDSDQSQDVTNGSNIDHLTNLPLEPPAKPPVAAKPVNLQNRFKVALNSNIVSSGAPIITDKTPIIDDTLKIIEPEQDLYCNTSAVVE